MQSIMTIPIGNNVNLSKVSLGLIQLLEKNELSVIFFKPVIILSEYKKNIYEIDVTIIINQIKKVFYIDSINVQKEFDLQDKKYYFKLLDLILNKYYSIQKNYDVIFIEGVNSSTNTNSINSLNMDIANTINSKIIFVTSFEKHYGNFLNKYLKILFDKYFKKNCFDIAGIIINKVHSLDKIAKKHYFLETFKPLLSSKNYKNYKNLFEQKLSNKYLNMIGYICWTKTCEYISVTKISDYLQAKNIFLKKNYIKKILFYDLLDQKIKNITNDYYKNCLLIISDNKFSTLNQLKIAITKGLKIGAILIVGEHYLFNDIKDVFKEIVFFNIPILYVKSKVLYILKKLQNFSINTINYEKSEINKIQKHVIKNVDFLWIINLIKNCNNMYYRNNSIMFKYNVKQLSKKLNKIILLPEGNEIRIIKAVSICEQLKIAKCVLLGNPIEIYNIALKNNIILKKNIKIINPELVRQNYVQHLVDKRRKNGMTILKSKELLKNNMILATLMLDKDEVDGVVSGSIDTTANTIRPALQLIKVQSNYSLISSVFFMLLDKQVLIFADCAVNILPSSTELAEIAIQSADTAKSFGINPKVAMISYATGNSAKGLLVEKVRLATKIAQERRPDLIIDGPMQYDTAVNKDVAKLKLSKSIVAGKATVIIFPDLNTGNSVYKAVQRSANISSIGPMLQGIRKPVNDLSRGASVEDIIYTIALTSIQTLKN